MKKKYVFPVQIEIDSDNPNVDARKIAEKIYDAVEAYSVQDFHGGWLDIKYSIYIKADEGEMNECR